VSESNRTPLIVLLIVVILAAVGFVVYQMQGAAQLSTSRQEGIARTQQGGPGSFTPAPR
jgi:hypothetical protein